MIRHVIPISGKDSLATALVQTARCPDLSYEYVFCDVGSELPETYEWLDKVESQTGWEIKRVGSDLESYIYKSKVLPSYKMRFCTSQMKIKPFEQAFGNDCKTFVYYGLRADENRVGLKPSNQLTPVYPLQELGINFQMVWQILAAKEMLPPAFFWTALYYQVCELLGSDYQILDELPPWQFRILFAGRTRGNCFHCFYQRQYEWAWLLDTYPNLFWRASRMENICGAEDFTWREGYYLEDKIIKDRKIILMKRAKKVIELLRQIFNRSLIDDSFDNEIAMTSCGLLCGK